MSAARPSRRLGAVALVTVLTATLAACGSSGDSASSQTPATCPGGKVRFGIEPYEDPAKLEPAYQVLADALSKKLDCPVEVQVVEDYSAEVLAMRNERLDLGQFGPLGYVFASEKAGAEPLVSFAKADGTLSTYTAGIWVPKDSPVQGVSDLKGKSLALSSVGSTSGDALPRYALKTAGIAESDVRSNYAGGHPEALLALTNKTVDAAEINSQTVASATAEGKFDASQYRQIWTSEPIPNDPITVRGSADPAFKEAVRSALLDLSPEDIKAVGGYLDVNPPGPMKEVSKETYQPLFDLATTMNLTEKDV